MESAYIFCLIIGGVFVGLSAFAGLDGVDFDQDFEADLEIINQENREEGNTSIYHQPRRRLWLPFLSWKFWTFSSCFFGLTGVVLSNLSTRLSANIIAIISIIVGILCGTIMSYVLYNLKNRPANSLVRSDDLLGLSGTVEIPFDKKSKGKIRVNVKESIVELIAFTEENKEFIKGEKVFIVGMENNKVWIVSEDLMATSSED